MVCCGGRWFTCLYLVVQLSLTQALSAVELLSHHLATVAPGNDCLVTESFYQTPKSGDMGLGL